MLHKTARDSWEKRGQTWEQRNTTAARGSRMSTTGQDYHCRNPPTYLATRWLPQGHHAIHACVSLFSFCARRSVLPCLRQHHRGDPPQKRVQGPNLGHQFETTNASTTTRYPPEFAGIRPFWAKLTGRVTLYRSPPTFMSCERNRRTTHNS